MGVVALDDQGLGHNHRGDKEGLEEVLTGQTDKETLGDYLIKKIYIYQLCTYIMVNGLYQYPPGDPYAHPQVRVEHHHGLEHVGLHLVVGHDEDVHVHGVDAVGEVDQAGPNVEKIVGNMVTLLVTLIS